MSEAGSNEPDAEPVLSLLQQRTIEAKIIGPLIRGFEKQFGREAVLPIVEEVITNLAKTSGAALSASANNNSLPCFAENLDRWKTGGALELNVLNADPSHLDFNVTRCRYAEMYRSLGFADLGFSLSCQRDFALIQGFNPAIELQRTQTIMEGAAFCDFRFRASANSKLDPLGD